MGAIKRAIDEDDEWWEEFHRKHDEWLASRAEEGTRMEIEVGKRYVCRGDSRVKFVEILEVCPDGYASGQAVDRAGREFQSTWRADGTWLYAHGANALDLVAEWGAPAAAATCTGGHSVVDTGCRVSWCRDCGASLVFDAWEWRPDPRRRA